jgi:hypothetical protein
VLDAFYLGPPAWTIAACLMVLPVLILRGWRLFPFTATLVWNIPIVTGHALLDTTASGLPVTWMYMIGLAAMVVGYCLVRWRPVQPDPNVNKHRDPGPALLVTVIVVCLLALYHFSVIGIPSLSSNVEIDRFNFTSSGLLGLPGRAYLYGLPIVTTGAMFCAARWPTRTARIAVALAVVVLLLTRLASGFKGGLIEVVIILFFASALIAGGLSLRRAAVRYLAIGSVALAFTALIAPAYASYSNLNTIELTSSLLNRATTGAALAGRLVMQPAPQLVLLPQNTAVNDFEYTAWRYLGIDLGTHFAFEQIVAASTYHARLSNTSAPQTVQAFPQLVYDHGLLLAALGSGLLGYLFAWLEVAGARMLRPMGFAIVLAVLLALRDYITKGGLVYETVNWAAMLLFILVVWKVSEIVLEIGRQYGTQLVPAAET